MKVHQCARCEGCGYVTGSFRWEIPWTHWASNPSDPEQQDGILEAHACPDCGGTGALIELDIQPDPQLRLPTRRGITREPSYAEHVESVLRLQRR